MDAGTLMAKDLQQAQTVATKHDVELRILGRVAEILDAPTVGPRLVSPRDCDSENAAAYLCAAKTPEMVRELCRLAGRSPPTE
ncbi:MAG: hypothetical protein AAFR51_00050 [Pseudomonadota bacterium]